jgi:hypothetical protein
LVFGEEPLLPAEVQRQGWSAQHGRHDPGVAGQSPGFAGGDRLAGVGGGDLLGELVEEGAVVEGDDDRGGDLAGELVGGQVLEELDQGPAVAVRPVAGVRERAPHLLLDVLAHLVAQVGVGGRGAGGPGRVGLTGVCAATSAVDPGRLPCVRPTRLGLLGGLLGEASWGGDLLDRLDQHRAGEGGDGEVAAGGAVTLVVPGEPGLLPRGVLLGLGAAVLVGIHLLGRALGGGQGPAGDLAQLGGRETCRLCHQVRPSADLSAELRSAGSCAVARAITAA